MPMPETTHAIRSLAHDVNGAMARVALAAGPLEDHDDPEVSRAARRIGRAMEAASEICGSAMRGRPEPSEPIVLGSVALERLLREVADLVVPKDIAREVPIRLEVAPGLRLRCDRTALMRIVLNLARNAATAIAASGRRGRVVVAAGADGDGVHLDVIDDGPGLPPHVLAFLMPRAGRTAPRRGRIGLGLPAALRMAAEMGGHVSLLRTGANGTAFRLHLAPARPGGGPA